MKKLILPKKYLSFSQITLWEKSKDTYRKQYYDPNYQGYPPTVYMRFGNEVTEAMERGEDWVRFIPHEKEFERKLEGVIDGVPFVAYIDTINSLINKFKEQKSTMKRWSKKKIDDHFQLDLYSLFLEYIDGFVEDECDLVWVETRKKEKGEIKKGLSNQGPKIELELTGNFEVTPRVITKEDRQKARERIVRVAREISEDFASLGKFYK